MSLNDPRTVATEKPPEGESANGRAPAPDDQWLLSLLSHPQVCALFTRPEDKAIAARVQANLTRVA